MTDIRQLEIKIAELNKVDNEQINGYNEILPHLGDLNWILGVAKEVGDKHDILNQIFLGGFRKEIKGGRTALLNLMFEENSLQIEALLRVEKKENL